MIPENLQFVSQNVYGYVRLLGEVRMVDFAVTETLNGSGSWSGSFLVEADDPVSQVDITEPWIHRIFVVSNDQPIYCLDIWNRSRVLGSNKVDISGKLGGSTLDRIIIGGRNGQSLSYTNIEQNQIARSLVTEALNEWGFMGVDPVTVTGSGSRYRDKTTWDASDLKPYGEALRDLVNLQNGFQYRFEPTQIPGNSTYSLRFVTGDPFISGRAPINVEYGDYGNGRSAGNIRSLRVEESVATMATNVIVAGSGEGTARLMGRAENADLGMVRIARTESRMDVITQSWLDDRASAIASASRTPLFPPQVGLSASDPVHPLGSYRTGDQVSLYVDPNPVFPSGLHGTWRIVEIAYDPQKYGEEVILTIADQGVA